MTITFNCSTKQILPRKELGETDLNEIVQLVSNPPVCHDSVTFGFESSQMPLRGFSRDLNDLKTL